MEICFPCIRSKKVLDKIQLYRIKCCEIACLKNKVMVISINMKIGIQRYLNMLNIHQMAILEFDTAMICYTNLIQTQDKHVYSLGYFWPFFLNCMRATCFKHFTNEENLEEENNKKIKRKLKNNARKRAQKKKNKKKKKRDEQEERKRKKKRKIIKKKHEEQRKEEGRKKECEECQDEETFNLQATKGIGTHPLRFFLYHTFCIWNKIMTYQVQLLGSICAHLEV